MLERLGLMAALTLPCWVLACSDDDAGSAPSNVAGAGQAGEASAGAGVPGKAPGGAGGVPATGGAPGGGGQAGTNLGGEVATGGAAPTLECGTGQICFFLDGAPLQKGAGGYRITHATLGQYAFVKCEQGADQLSIEIYSLEPGTFEVLDVPKEGAARVAWYSNDPSGQHTYQGRSGTVTVTELDDEFFISGSFSAELELTEDEQYTGEKRSVTSGTFTHVSLPAI